MLPKYHEIPLGMNSFFNIVHSKMPFGKEFHYHKALELQYTIRGKGTRFVGDNESYFSNDEVVLLGENLPHCWQSEHHNSKEQEEFIVLHFSPGFLGDGFFMLEESQPLLHLFQKARKGLYITKESKERVIALLKSILNMEGFGRIVSFLDLLKVLLETDDYSLLSESASFGKKLSYDEKRIKSVYDFTRNNFSENVHLEEVASICNLTVTSFCRFFKKTTGKTYYEYLMEIRIDHACRLLHENDYTIEQVAFECGFDSVSGFYTQFKKIKNTAPGKYMVQSTDL